MQISWFLHAGSYYRRSRDFGRGGIECAVKGEGIAWMQKKRLEAHLKTMRAIAASKSVRKFYIGFTSRDPYLYCAWYRRNGYDHTVILADWLTEKDAKLLEKYLQECCYQADKRTPLWLKAHENIQKGRYYLGARSPRPKEKIHAVYIAWLG